MYLGPSKQLIEEENFRKNGKQKFTQLSEKLLQTVHLVQNASEGLAIDYSKLSSQGQDLLKGNFQNRLELMHLHTTTHGTKRWSGDKETLKEGTENNENSNTNMNGNTNGISKQKLTPKTVSKPIIKIATTLTSKNNVSTTSTSKIASLTSVKK